MQVTRKPPGQDEQALDVLKLQASASPLLCEELHFARAASRSGIRHPASGIRHSVNSFARSKEWWDRRCTREPAPGGAHRSRPSASEQARLMLRQADAMQLAIHQASPGFVGNLSICYVATATQSGSMPRIVCAFPQQRSDVEIGLQEMDMLPASRSGSRTVHSPWASSGRLCATSQTALRHSI